MFRDERPRSKLHVWTSRAESAWPIYDPDYRRRRLQAACKAASNQRGRQPCLLRLRSNRGTKGLGHLAPGELIQRCVGEDEQDYQDKTGIWTRPPTRSPGFTE